jgi:transposase InsO family protein
VWGLDLIDPL